MASTEICSPPRTAQELLLEFKATGRQEPFEEIVRRYAGMVYHVCLRVTRNNHDAEDATQAVFLTLAVQARQNKEIRYIGPWLQQVANRLSLDLRKSKRRREKREERHGQTVGCERVECECAQQMHFEELKGLINQEINKLPPKYRVPLIMHYFGGLSREEMAQELQCKPGTLGVRLHRAREMLGERLARRGVAMAEGTMSLAVAYAVQSVVADQIISSTCQAASQIVIGNPVTTHLVPAQLIAMARGAVHSVLMAKVKTVAALLVAMGCAMAAGAEVVSKVTPLDLGLDLQLRIGDWVKEHLLPFSSPLQVNGTDEAGTGTDALPEMPIATMPFTWGGPSNPGMNSIELPAPKSLHLPQESLAVGGGGSGLGVVIQQEFGVRPPLMLTPSLASHDRPPRVARQWDALANHRIAPAPIVRALPGPFAGGSLHLHSPPHAAPVLPAFRDRGGDRSPHVSGPALPGPWRPEGPQLPKPDRGRTGDGNRPPVRPNKPGGKPSHDNNGNPGGNGGNGGGNNSSQSPVQLATGGGPGSVALYLQPEATTSNRRTPRSPAAASIRSDSVTGSGSGASYTSVNYGSLADAVFNVSPSTSGAPVRSVLHSNSDFSGLAGTGAPVSLDVVGAGGAVAPYTDQTFFKFDQQSEKLVVLGRQSRAKLTGMTVESTPGRLSGWGVVGPADVFDQSGQVVADGLGQARMLDLSSIRMIRNDTDNTGANGWYARNGGKVVLPEIRVLPGTRTYTWGENASDPQLDLVNSVRVRVKEALTPGRLQIALSSLNGADVPPLPAGEQLVGLWQLEMPGVYFGGADLTVRYDDGLIADLGMNEGSVRLWGYGGGAWQPISDGFTLDSNNNLVTGSVGSVSHFAVAATPEPGMLGVMVGASLLLRRRRH